VNYQKVEVTEVKHFSPPFVAFQTHVQTFGFVDNVHSGKKEEPTESI